MSTLSGNVFRPNPMILSKKAFLTWHERWTISRVCVRSLDIVHALLKMLEEAHFDAKSIEFRLPHYQISQLSLQ